MNNKYIMERITYEILNSLNLTVPFGLFTNGMNLCISRLFIYVITNVPPKGYTSRIILIHLGVSTSAERRQRNNSRFFSAGAREYFRWMREIREINFKLY